MPYWEQDGLKFHYSERGQAYVDSVKGIIQKNNLDVADGAVFRDEPMAFIFAAADQDAAAKTRYVGSMNYSSKATRTSWTLT